MKHILAIIFYLLIPSISYAQSSDDTTHTNVIDKAIGLAETVLGALTVEKPQWSLAIYPAASYSGRSGLAIGIMPMLQLRNTSLLRPATITPSALISTKGMWEVQCDADIYLKHNQTITAKAEFYYQPDDYYGYASVSDGKKLTEYDYRRYMFTSDYLKGIGRGWLAGLSIDITYHDFNKIATDSAALREEILSAEKWDNGLGLVVSYDTRDNTLNARTGWYSRARVTTYRNWAGSKRNFTTSSFDIRHYWPIGEESVVAAQLYIATASSKAPFHKMATMGGTRLGRAIPHNLKYVDRIAYLMQAEARFPLWWRIGATGWTAIGNVAHKADKDLTSNMHGMIGCGLRFKVFPSHGLNLRLDGGVSTKGDNAIYFNIREAF